MNKPLGIHHIQQKDNHHFSIKWNDGILQDFKLSELQKKCPCANCVDELTGDLLLNPETVAEDVRAIVIRNVGRYGLRIQFTSGCSKGIYSFTQLRKLKEIRNDK